MVDEAAGTGTARGDADAACPREVDDLGDGEEVGGEAQHRDGAQLGLQAMARIDAVGALITIERALAS